MSEIKEQYAQEEAKSKIKKSSYFPGIGGSNANLKKSSVNKYADQSDLESDVSGEDEDREFENLSKLIPMN